MNTIFATGITPNYEPTALPLLNTALAHKIPLRLYLVNYFDIPTRLMAHQCKAVRYSDQRLPLPKFMLQHGGFTIYDNEPDDQVVVFMDADARFQRRLIQADYDALSPKAGEFLIGRNKPDLNQPLSDEFTCLGPKVAMDDCARHFPGMEKMVCRNTGFVAARRADWKEMYKAFNELWPECERSFNHYAAVQWLICYLAQRSFRLGDIPLTIHTHGHLGLNEGVHNQNGVWMLNDKVILFAHHLP